MAKPRTPWDAAFKEVVTLLGGQAGAAVTTEYEVGRLPRKIDSVAVCDEAARAWLAEHTPLDFLNEHAILEGKSVKDYLTPQELLMIMGRAYFYQAQENLLDLSRFTVCVVSAGFPRKVLREVPQLIRFQPVRKALWRAETHLPLYVLVCSELDVAPRNYPFLLFATGKKRREFLRALVQETSSPYLAMALELYPRDVTEELKMSKKRTTWEEDMRYFLDYVGLETIARSLPPNEETVRALLEHVPPEAILDALLERLDPATLEAQLQARQAHSQGGGQSERHHGKKGLDRMAK
jgi:hypothetical protein